MTFSICVRERYEDAGDEHHRFGVAVTTRLPGVGTLCPFASENGAIATQSLVNVDLGRRGIEYVDDGLAIADALEALLNADDGAPERQLHGVDAADTFAFSGEECRDWYGHLEGPNYTVAGNLLTGEAVLEATADAYEERAVDRSRADASDDRDDPLAERLIEALAAGHAAGGDKRTDLTVQSGAVLVRTTEEREPRPYYDDLRVDATETPIADLRETYALAVQGFEDATARYEDENEPPEDSRGAAEGDG